MKFRYMGDCAAGFVEFVKPMHPTITMPKGEAVECPDWLTEKLMTNSHFEVVDDQKPVEAPVDDSPPADDFPPQAAKELKPGMGECPDCGGIFRLRKDGLLYKHACGS